MVGSPVELLVAVRVVSRGILFSPCLGNLHALNVHHWLSRSIQRRKQAAVVAIIWTQRLPGTVQLNVCPVKIGVHRPRNRRRRIGGRGGIRTTVTRLPTPRPAHPALHPPPPTPPPSLI